MFCFLVNSTTIVLVALTLRSSLRHHKETHCSPVFNLSVTILEYLFWTIRIMSSAQMLACVRSLRRPFTTRFQKSCETTSPCGHPVVKVISIVSLRIYACMRLEYNIASIHPQMIGSASCTKACVIKCAFNVQEGTKCYFLSAQAILNSTQQMMQSSLTGFSWLIGMLFTMMRGTWKYPFSQVSFYQSFKSLQHINDEWLIVRKDFRLK